MDRNIPTYKIFLKEIFFKLENKEKNELFYWSLLDYSSWEDGNTPFFMPNFNRGKKRVLAILKKKSKNFKKRIEKNPDKFYKLFIEKEFLANYLLGAELENKLKEDYQKKWEVDTKNIESKSTIFPDIIMRSYRGLRINIEIKGKISASNLADRIEEYVLERIIDKKRGYTRFLLLLIFPVCPKENARRVNQLIEGYYIYEKLLKGKFGRRRVICNCLEEKNYKGDFSFSKLVEKIIESYFLNIK